MKLTVDTGTLCKRAGEETIFNMIKEAGFDGVDYSMCTRSENYNMLGEDYEEKACKTKKLLDETDLICEQSHAPFVFKYEDEFSLNNERYVEIIRSIHYASIIGCENVVVHYIKNDIPYNVDYIDYNLRFYESLVPYLEKYNVKISVENLYRHNPTKKFCYGALLCDPVRHLEFMEKLDSRYFNICLDIGHSAVTGYLPENSIRVLGKNIAVTHIHDTDYNEDCHMPPYTKKHNWDEITKAFKETGYKGNISLELPTFFKNLPDNLLLDGLKYAHSTGRELIRMISDGE